MKELTIQDIERMLKEDESRVLEVKQTTGELDDGMRSGCAFLNTEGGWLFFGIHPKKLTILGQDVADRTRQEVAYWIFLRCVRMRGCQSRSMTLCRISYA